MKPAFDHSLLEEYANDLYENAPCGYVSTLPDGSIIKVNTTFVKMIGFDSHELLSGKRFQDLLTVGGKVYYETHFGPLLRMQGFVKEVTFDLISSFGQKIPVLTSVLQRRDLNDNPLVNRFSVFDITDRRKYERELLIERQKAEQATRAKADFLSLMSHEIRTPMNAVVGVANLLQTTDLSEVQKEYLGLLKTSSDNLMNLLNSILDFSKIESGHATLESRNFDLKKIMRDCVTALRARAQQKNLKLTLKLDSKIPNYLVGDPVKIGQVLNNLVSNAIKFTDVGEVTVACRSNFSNDSSSSLTFSVSDTGIGIPLDKQSAIFEEFAQANYEIGMQFGGTGLGLAISKKIVEMYGSKINVQSEVGKGSIFSFDLTLKVGVQPSIDVTQYHQPNPAQLVGLQVLLAEDNADNTFLLERFFKSWGINLTSVKNGREAVERVRTSTFDIILMDLRMPLMDGYAAANAIRLLPGKSKSELPILAFSASTKVGEEDLVTIADFNDIVGKPFLPEELFSKLAFYAGRLRQ